jgi:protein gp37
MGNPRYRNGFMVTFHEDLIELPKRWREPRLIFVNSMSDLFHEQVPLEFIQRVFATMRACSQHTFQILTKRSGHDTARKIDRQPTWMGVSEDSRVLSRVDDLREFLAIRFLSCEPLIGSLAGIDLTDIHWVIVGGESGWGARPVKIEWIREIFKACRKQNVPFFFKQWGGVRKDLTGRLLRGRTYDEMPVRVAA